jgi:hypothetical protein
MRLKKAQKEAVLQWIAEGLESDEINKRAAKFKPRFTVSRSQVDWYRKTRGVKLDEIQEADETSALKTGFAVKDERVKALQKLAEVMLDQLTREEDNRLWTQNAKGIGSGEDFERYDYEEFNKAEVDALRGVFDDIAAEVGQRVRKTDVTSGGKPLPRSGFDPSQWKKYSDDELAALERAAALLERNDAP